jgi:hypothetical protein
VWTWLATLAVAAVVVVVVVASGGSDGSKDAVDRSTTQPRPSDASTPSEGTLPPPSTGGTTADEVAGSPAGSTGTRSNPVALGQIADIGAGWRLQVVQVVDGTEAVAAVSEFNDPPPAGSAFTLVTVAIGYFGREDPKSAFEPNVSAVGASSVELPTDCGLIPDGLDVFRDVFAGGVVVGNLCFVTQAADADVLQLYATGGFFSGDEVYLDARPGGPALPMEGLTGPREGAAATPMRLDPKPLGVTSDIGSGWTLTVTGAARDITDAVAAEGSFNDPPPQGFRFVGVDVALDYSGDGVSSAFDVTTRAVASDNLELTGYCGSVPGALDEFVDVFSGGSIAGTICFVVPQGSTGLLLYSSTGFDAPLTWFATE